MLWKGDGGYEGICSGVCCQNLSIADTAIDELTNVLSATEATFPTCILRSAGKGIPAARQNMILSDISPLLGLSFRLSMRGVHGDTLGGDCPRLRYRWCRSWRVEVQESPWTLGLEDREAIFVRMWA
jgi:hypothetical protein